MTIDQTGGSVQLPFRSHLDRSRIGHDARARRHRRNAASAFTATYLLGARCLGGERLYLSGHRVVGFLSLALSATLDLSPFRFCPDLADDLISCRAPAFSTRRRH